jgi:hypothetical protein
MTGPEDEDVRRALDVQTPGHLRERARVVIRSTCEERGVHRHQRLVVRLGQKRESRLLSKGRQYAYRLGLDKTHVVVLRVDERVLVDPRVFRGGAYQPHRPLALGKDSTASEYRSLILVRIFDGMIRDPLP